MTQHTIENDLATTRRNLDWWFTEAQRLRAKLKAVAEQAKD